MTKSLLLPARKPLYPSEEKPYTPPKKAVKAMTIAIGFRVKEGLVLCADRLMSHGGPSEPDSFAHYETKTFAECGWDYAAAMCGAANEGNLLRPFSQLFFERLNASVDKHTGLEIREVKPILESTLAELSAQVNHIPDMSLLIGVTIRYVGLLFLKTQGLVVEHAKPVEVLGIGERSLVDFFIEGLYQEEMPLEQVKGLAALVIHYAKKYCPQYCGGDTDICSLPQAIGDYDIQTVKEHSQIEADLIAQTMAHLSSLPDGIAKLLK